MCVLYGQVDGHSHNYITARCFTLHAKLQLDNHIENMQLEVCAQTVSVCFMRGVVGVFVAPLSFPGGR